MFLVSAALVGVAIVLLLVGIITGTLMLVYLAIGVSVVSMILLGVGIFLQRELLWGKRREREADAGSAPEAELEPVGAALAAPSAAGAAPGAGSGDLRNGAAGPAHRADSGFDAISLNAGLDGELVQVVPGRRRYHRTGCASLNGRATEELTVGEAREEGFSACTACFPVEAEDEPAEADFPAPVAAPPIDPQSSAAAAEDPGTATAGTQATGPAGATADGAGPARPGAASRASGESVWVVRGVSRYHRSDCVLIRSVDGGDVDPMSQAQAEASGCTPCRACNAAG